MKLTTAISYSQDHTEQVELDFMFQEFLDAWSPYSQTYVDAHQDPSTGLMPETVKTCATGMLQWILEGRWSEMSGIFTEQDFLVLLDCFQGDLAFPYFHSSLASQLCEHLGGKARDANNASLERLLAQLQELDFMHQFALRVLLEQLWRTGLPNGSIQEFLAPLNIALWDGAH
jgi:hypothetical protein